MSRRLVACTMGLVMCGCVSMRGPQALRAEVDAAYGVGLEQRVVMSMNTLALVMGPFPADMKRALWHIEWFHAGTYRVVATVDAPAAVDLATFVLPGWRRQMYARELLQEFAAMVRADGDDIREMAVLIQDGQDLTIVHLVGNIDRFLASRQGTDELLHTIDDLQLFFEHLGIAQMMLNTSAEAHRQNEARIRDVLTDTGWLPAPAESLEEAGPPGEVGTAGPPKPQGD